MSVKVAINGFGRIGRLAFRQMFGAEGYEVVAINDLTSPKMLAHLLKYDSSQGRYVNFGEEDQVTADDEAGTITVKGKTIKIYKEPDANNCPWGELDVDVVLECSGFYTSKAKAQAHINAGAKKVVISAPAGNDLKTIVYNVNHETLTAEDNIISAASYGVGDLPRGGDLLRHLQRRAGADRLSRLPAEGRPILPGAVSEILHMAGGTGQSGGRASHGLLHADAGHGADRIPRGLHRGIPGDIHRPGREKSRF